MMASNIIDKQTAKLEAIKNNTIIYRILLGLYASPSEKGLFQIQVFSKPGKKISNLDIKEALNDIEKSFAANCSLMILNKNYIFEDLNSIKSYMLFADNNTFLSTVTFYHSNQRLSKFQATKLTTYDIEQIKKHSVINSYSLPVVKDLSSNNTYTYKWFDDGSRSTKYYHHIFGENIYTNKTHQNNLYKIVDQYERIFKLY